jgi:hypothetical protein
MELCGEIGSAVNVGNWEVSLGSNLDQGYKTIGNVQKT